MEKTVNRTPRFDSEFVFNYSLCPALSGIKPYTNNYSLPLSYSLLLNYSLFTNDYSLPLNYSLPLSYSLFTNDYSLPLNYSLSSSKG